MLQGLLLSRRLNLHELITYIQVISFFLDLSHLFSFWYIYFIPDRSAAFGLLTILAFLILPSQNQYLIHQHQRQHSSNTTLVPGSSNHPSDKT